MKTRINKFGFEIEGEFSDVVSNWLAQYGTIKIDGSLRRCLSGKHVHPVTKNPVNLNLSEFASNPFEISKRKTANEIFSYLYKARERGEYHWNKSCGFHVHVSFKPKPAPEMFSKQFAEFFLGELRRTFQGVVNKRGKNHFCEILEPLTDEKVYFTRNRYQFINFGEAYRKYGTIEFRIFPAAHPARMAKFLLFTLRTINKWLAQELKVEFNSEIEEKVKRKEIIEVVAQSLSGETILNY